MAYIETEQKLLYILLNDKEIVEKFKSINKIKFLFDSKHQILVEGILWAFDKDSLLTRNGYIEFLRNVKIIPNKEEVISELVCHDTINMQVTPSSEYQILIESVKNNWLEKKTAEAIVKFKGNKSKFGNKKALSYLKNELGDLELFSEESKNEFIQFNDEIKVVDRIKDKRENPSKIIKTHITELDWAIPRGLAPGHFTIFCGDVGSGKSTIMINIALNIYNLSNNKILYIPIEMSRDEIIDKALSRETKIGLRSISTPDKTNLTDNDLLKLEEQEKKWKNFENRFSILKMYPSCTTQDIEKELEKRYSWFQPDVVFLDYMDLIRPRERLSRSDQEISSIIHHLRALGGQMNFSIVTAAQLTRDSLKKLSEKGKGQIEFGSKDVRGGQAVSADSDNVFCQIPDVNALDMYIIKSRFGGKYFQNNSGKTSLFYDPCIGLIQSQFQNDALLLTNDMGSSDLGFFDPPPTIDDNENPFT